MSLLIFTKQGKILLKADTGLNLNDLPAVKKYLKGILSDLLKINKSFDLLIYRPILLKGKVGNIGEVRTWGGKKYKKIKKDKWVRIYEHKQENLKQFYTAIRRVMNKIDRAKDITEIATILKTARHQFYTNLKKKDKEMIDRIFEHAKMKAGKGAEFDNTVDPEKVNRDRNYGDVQIVKSELTQFSPKNYIPNRLLPHLEKHQQDGVNLAMYNYENGNKGFIIADGAGSGKTRQALTVAYLKAMQNESAVFITTQNKNIINDSFLKEANKLGVPVKVVTKIPETGIKKGTIYITTYDKLENFKDAEIDDIIMDEAHNMKNVSSEKTKHGIGIIKNAKNVLAVTATPMDKLEHIPYLIHSLGIDENKAFSDLGFHKSKKSGKWLLRRDVPDEVIAQRINKLYNGLTQAGAMIRREIPLKNTTFSTETIQLTPEQRTKYNEIYQAFKDRLKDMKGKKGKGMLKANGLMEIRRYLEEVKIDKTMELMKQELSEGRQVVLLAHRVNESEVKGQEGKIYTSPGTLKEIEKRLASEGITGISKLYANVKDKQEEINKFNSGENKVLIATPQSGGTGINLDDITGDKPRTLLEMTAPFSANELVQNSARVDRYTTKSKVKVKLLVTDTEVDTWNMNVISTKMKNLGAVMSSDNPFEKLLSSESEDKGKENRLNIIEKLTQQFGDFFNVKEWINSGQYKTEMLLAS